MKSVITIIPTHKKSVMLYYSGAVRTLFATAPKLFNTVRRKLPYHKIHVRYSFWDSIGRSGVRGPGEIYLEDYDLPTEAINTANIDQFFLSLGAESTEGEIESTDLMHDIIEGSKLPETKKGLDSQYYKISRVVQTYPPIGKDSVCVRMRADVYFDDFPGDDIISKLDSSMVILEGHYWASARAFGTPPKTPLNEMVWISNGQTFLRTCSENDYLDEIVSNLETKDIFGESITSKWFGSLVDSGEISDLVYFDFKYRILR